MKIKSITFVTAMVLACCAFTSCEKKQEKTESVLDTSSSVVQATNSTITAEQDKPEVKQLGSFVITLYPEYAPETCKNFEKLVGEGFYDGLTFHRVVNDFMAQGGDPLGNGTGGSDEKIKGEFSQNGVENPLSHKRGVVSMARSSDFNSASSQFFICYNDDCTFLDGQYAAFGEVTEGMEVVDGFLNVERTQNSGGEYAVPKIPIKITSAKMIENDQNGNPRVEFAMQLGE